MKLLLKHGHHVNVRTSQGSALHEAAICGKVGRENFEVSRFLEICNSFRIIPLL